MLCKTSLSERQHEHLCAPLSLGKVPTSQAFRCLRKHTVTSPQPIHLHGLPQGYLYCRLKAPLQHLPPMPVGGLAAEGGADMKAVKMLLRHNKLVCRSCMRHLEALHRRRKSASLSCRMGSKSAHR